MGLPGRASPAATWSLSRIVPSEPAAAAARLRLSLVLSRTPFQNDLAPQLLRELAKEPVTATSNRGLLYNFVHQDKRLRIAEAKRGAVYLDPAHYTDISTACSSYARSLAYAMLRTAARAELDNSLLPHTAAARPSSAGPARFFASMRFWYWEPPLALGTAAGMTSLSLQGPGCSGSLLATCDRRSYPGVSAIQCGPLALRLYPFITRRDTYERRIAQNKQREQRRQHPPEDADDAAAARGGRARPSKKRRKDLLHEEYKLSCELCGGAERDFIHLACECPSPALLHCVSLTTRTSSRTLSTCCAPSQRSLITRKRRRLTLLRGRRLELQPRQRAHTRHHRASFDSCSSVRSRGPHGQQTLRASPCTRSPRGSAQSSTPPSFAPSASAVLRQNGWGGRNHASSPSPRRGGTRAQQGRRRPHCQREDLAQQSQWQPSLSWWSETHCPTWAAAGPAHVPPALLRPSEGYGRVPVAGKVIGWEVTEARHANVLMTRGVTRTGVLIPRPP